MYVIYLEIIFAVCNPMQVVIFDKNVLIFVEQRLTFSHFKGSTNLRPLILVSSHIAQITSGRCKGYV